MSEPTTPDIADLIASVSAVRGIDGVLPLLREINSNPSMPNMTLRELMRAFGLPEPVLRAEARVIKARVTKPTLLQQCKGLPRREQLLTLLIILAVLASLDLPPEVQDRIGFFIAEVTAAITAIKWISKR